MSGTNDPIDLFSDEDSAVALAAIKAQKAAEAAADQAGTAGAAAGALAGQAAGQAAGQQAGAVAGQQAGGLAGSATGAQAGASAGQLAGGTAGAAAGLAAVQPVAQQVAADAQSAATALVQVLAALAIAGSYPTKADADAALGNFTEGKSVEVTGTSSAEIGIWTKRSGAWVRTSTVTLAGMVNQILGLQTLVAVDEESPLIWGVRGGSSYIPLGIDKNGRVLLVDIKMTASDVEGPYQPLWVAPDGVTMLDGYQKSSGRLMHLHAPAAMADISSQLGFPAVKAITDGFKQADLETGDIVPVIVDTAGGYTLLGYSRKTGLLSGRLDAATIAHIKANLGDIGGLPAGLLAGPVESPVVPIVQDPSGNVLLGFSQVTGRVSLLLSAAATADVKAQMADVLTAPLGLSSLTGVSTFYEAFNPVRSLGGVRFTGRVGAGDKLTGWYTRDDIANPAVAMAETASREMDMLIRYGESLSIGSGGGPLTGGAPLAYATPPDIRRMFKFKGVQIRGLSNVLIDPATLTDLEGAKEEVSQQSSNRIDTGLVAGMVWDQARRAAAGLAPQAYFIYGAGSGGINIAQAMPGGIPYSNFYNQGAAAFRLLKAYGRTAKVAISYVQGMNDRTWSLLGQYLGPLFTLCGLMRRDIRKLGGLSYDPKIILLQMHQDSSNHLGVAAADVGVVPRAQLRAHEEGWAQIFMPSYQLPYTNDPPGVHPSQLGYIHMGEYERRGLYLLDTFGDTGALRVDPANPPTRSGAVVTINLIGGMDANGSTAGTLKLDGAPALLTILAAKGFRYRDSSWIPSIVVKAGGNVGDGTIALDAVLDRSTAAVPGIYTVRCIATGAGGGTFEMRDPGGNLITVTYRDDNNQPVTSSSVAMVAGAAGIYGPVRVTLKAGATTPFAVGDGWDIAVGTAITATSAAVTGPRQIQVTLSADPGANVGKEIAYADYGGPGDVAPVDYRPGTWGNVYAQSADLSPFDNTPLNHWLCVFKRSIT